MEEAEDGDEVEGGEGPGEGAEEGVVGEEGGDELL